MKSLKLVIAFFFCSVMVSANQGEVKKAQEKPVTANVTKKSAPVKTDVPKEPRAVATHLTNEELAALSIAAETVIEVSSYDSEADVYTVSIKSEPDVGPNYVSPQELHRAVGSTESLGEFTAKKSSLLGVEFKLTSKMVLVSEEEVAKKLGQ